MRRHGAWLKLYCCVLGVPLVWLSGPVVSTVWARSGVWRSVGADFLGGFVLSAPEKPAELIRYALTATALLAYSLLAFRQIEVSDGGRRVLVIDRVSDRLPLPAAAAAAVGISLVLCVLARGFILVPGLAVDCCVWIVVAVVPFLPARGTNRVVAQPFAIAEAIPGRGVFTRGVDAGSLVEDAPRGRGRLWAGAVGAVLSGETRRSTWAWRVVMSLVVVFLGALLVGSLWPFLSGRLVVVNEYPDFREYVRILGAGDAFTEQSAFIATSAVGGLVPYGPLRDKGLSPRLPAGMAVKLRWSSRLEAFLAARTGQAVYDVARGAVVFIGGWSTSDRAALKACAVGSRERRRVDVFAAAAPQRAALVSSYPATKRAFVETDSTVLKWQLLPSFFFHHQSAFLSPLTAGQNGEWLPRDSAAYGWLSTLLLGLLVRLLGGLEFSRYLAVSYAFYVAYAALFVLAVFCALRTWSARLLAVLLAFGAFYMTGFWQLYLAPGFNPLRHLFDIVCLMLFLKGLSKARPTFWILLALAVAVLQIAMSREFGACLFVGAFVATAAFALWRPGRLGGHRLVLGGLAACILAVAVSVALAAPGATDSTSRYLVMGVWVDAASGELIAALLLLLLGGLAIFGFSRGDDRERFGFLMWLSYLACLWIYFVWNPEPGHLWSLGPVAALAAGLALENVASFTGRSLAALLGALSVCVVIAVLVLPGRAKFSAEHAQYAGYVANHRVFDWRVGAGDQRSTADPQMVARDVPMIRDAAAGDRVFMISKYQSLLLFLAGKTTGFPWNDLMLALVTQTEMDEAVKAIRDEKPAVLFVDRDIERSYVGDIVNSADPLLRGLQRNSLQRVAVIENLEAVFAAVQDDYQLVREGDLIDVYARR